MRKLDTLILKAFIGPFALTTVVATFILLIQYMLKYFDDFVGKDLGFGVFAELIFYFSLNMLQVALPLGVLVSSLMTFGNLGEHFELTAIKSAGISLIRALRPIFFFVVILSYAAFLFNNHVVPRANLQAYSLLYDIKHTKPALDIKEGVFYNGIPDFSIKVKEKLPDNQTLLNVLIYDHTDGQGNNRVILADSSRMFTMYNDRYLKLELFNGNYYSETKKAREPVDQLFRSNFQRMDMMFSLSSFDLRRTKKELFQNNRQMKNVQELTKDIDSLKGTAFDANMGFVKQAKAYFRYHLKDRIDENKENPYFPKRAKDTLDNERKLQASFISFLYPQEDKVRSKDKNSVQTLGNDSLTLRNSVRAKPNETGLANLRKKSTKVIMDSIKFVGKSKPAFAQEEQKSILEKKEPTTSNLQNSSIRESASKALAGENVMESRRRSGFAKKYVPIDLDTLDWAFIDAQLEKKKSDVVVTAKNQAQNIKVNLSSTNSRVRDLTKNLYKWTIEKYKKYSQAMACIVMFLIGAPLGAIIKKGGLGVPVIISIFFFIIFYVLTIMSEKWAKEGLMDPLLAVWIPNICLLPFGLFFLRQARIDARLFDTDFYNIWIDRFKTWLSKEKNTLEMTDK